MLGLSKIAIHYPLSLYGTTFFSILDLAMGYSQIEIDVNSKQKTAFLTKYGL